MRLALLALLLFTPIAQAGDGPDDYKLLSGIPSLDALNQNAGYADSYLGPCQGHEHIAVYAFPKPAPAACPKALAAVAKAQKDDIALRENCRELTAWLSSEHKKGNVCAHKEKLYEALAVLRKQETGDSSVDVDDQYLKAQLGDEATKPECLEPAALAFLGRKKNLSLRNKHYGVADSSILMRCEDKEAGEDYLLFVEGKQQ